MNDAAKLIPELKQWNEGSGISPSDWIFIEGRADQAIALCELLWPPIVEFEGYVLREPINVEHLRGWEGTGQTRQQIETAMNAFLMEGIFPTDTASPPVKKSQVEHLAKVMTQMLSAKLAQEFPDRNFSVFVMGGYDFGVSFHQT